MKLAISQRGLSSIGILLVMMVGAFALICALKLIPVYIDGATVDSSISSAVENGEFNGLSISKVKESIRKRLEINRIEGLSARDIKITKKKGEVIIDASHEQRIPLLFNIDVVVKFEDLIYEYSSEQ